MADNAGVSAKSDWKSIADGARQMLLQLLIQPRVCTLPLREKSVGIWKTRRCAISATVSLRGKAAMDNQIGAERDRGGNGAFADRVHGDAPF